MRKALLLFALAFGITFAVVVAGRLSDQALAVVIGAICGATASVPANIALWLAAQRRLANSRLSPEPPSPAAGTGDDYARMPLVFFSPSPSTMGYTFSGAPYNVAPPAGRTPYSDRDFKIVGDE